MACSTFDSQNPARDWRKCWPRILDSVFLLGANRAHTPWYSTVKDSLDLKPEAENLVQVLRTIHHSTSSFPESREEFEAIESELKTIFPEISKIRPETIDRQPTQEDISQIVLDLRNGQRVPLSGCGTGIFQILALLTASHLKTEPSLFLIDEPHPYLHPSAERGLIRILEELPKARGHIFCLATHSPIMSSQCKRSLFAVVNRGDDSKVLSLTDDAEILEVLGIANVDLFTYDKILFVEGESDVQVFQFVLNSMDTSGKTDRVKLADLSGDSKYRNINSACAQKRLLLKASASKARVPVGFLFDSAGKKEQEKYDLKKALHDLPMSAVDFLAKPELEDYLLDPRCIVAVLNKERRTLGLEEQAGLFDDVNEIIRAGDIKGSSILNKCYFAGLKRDFRKKVDSPALAREILATDPEVLKPLYEELAAFVEKIGASQVKAAPGKE